MPQPRKEYEKKQILIPLYQRYQGISTGEFVEILKCNRNTARRILLEMQKEGLVTETGIQTQVCFGKTKQSVTQKQEGLRNNLNPWRITEAGKKYVESSVQAESKPQIPKPSIDTDYLNAVCVEEPELELSEQDKNCLLRLLDGEYIVYGCFETPVILEDAELIEFFRSEEDELPEYEARLTSAGRTYARKLKDVLLEQYAEKYNAYLEADRKYLIRLYYGEKLIAAQISHSYSLRYAEYIDFPKHDDVFHTQATLTEKGKQWVESHLEPYLISEQLLTFDEIDGKPVLCFAIPIGNENVNGWIEIEEYNEKERDVMLVIHTETEAALDLTELFDAPILDGTRKLRVNRKVAYALFQMILEKPVLQCGFDESED